jgi:transcriptional regulator with XRE-family HTH domain
MAFPERLATLRRGLGLSQPTLAERIGVHVSQLRRYEAGTSQPTLDVLRRTAGALSCSADALLFDQDEHGPVEELRLQFEAASRLDAAEIHIVKALLEGLLLEHEAKRLAAIG